MLASAQPDLVVVDYLMPGLDGLEFITQIRRTRAHAALEIVMLSGVVSDQLRLAALAAGASKAMVSEAIFVAIEMAAGACLGHAGLAAALME
jgi:CheY-like chemotaxis protein